MCPPAPPSRTVPSPSWYYHLTLLRSSGTVTAHIIWGGISMVIDLEPVVFFALHLGCYPRDARLQTELGA